MTEKHIDIIDSSCTSISNMSTLDDIEKRNEYIDKLTLEMLMTKTNYNKYIAKTDPAQHDALQIYKSKINNYAKKIIGITTEMINNLDASVNTDVGDTFHDYTKALIQYFEMKEIENAKSYNEDDHDDDTLFDPEKMEDKDTTVKPSFWGKSKIIKKSALNSYDMAMFSK